MTKTAKLLILCGFAGAAMSGCSTVSIPKIDFSKLPEFSEVVKNNQTNVPDVSEIPAEPESVRSDADWDTDAQRLLALRDGFQIPVNDTGLETSSQVDAEFERLKAKAQAYKLDDP